MSKVVGSLTKVFATVAAMMTVTAGLPLFGYVSPDGQVKLSYLHFTSEDCSVPTSSTSIDSPVLNTAPTGPDGPRVELMLIPRGGERTVLEDGAAYTSEVEEDGEDVAGEITAFNRWEITFVIPVPLNRMNFKGRQASMPPTDLIIEHCHLTC